jgi:hypothetical protein
MLTLSGDVWGGCGDAHRYCGNFAVPDPHDLGLPNGDYFDKLFHDRQVCVCVCVCVCVFVCGCVVCVGGGI